MPIKTWTYEDLRNEIESTYTRPPMSNTGAMGLGLLEGNISNAMTGFWNTDIMKTGSNVAYSITSGEIFNRIGKDEEESEEQSSKKVFQPLHIEKDFLIKKMMDIKKRLHTQ
jgi:hypothetical protein